MKQILDEARRGHVRALDEALRAIVARLGAVPAVRRISVIGSYAQGRFDLFTDLDLVVVMETEEGPVERLRTLYGLIAAPVDVDILCYTPKEFQVMKETGFLRRALESERVLLERAT